MARINLLPWRVERRKQRQKDFMTMLGLSALGAGLLAFLIVNYYSRQISGQNERNAFLTQKIAEVQKQIDEIKTLDDKKARLLKRKEIIEDLQSDRSQMVHLFDSLVRTIPDGVALANIKQEGEILTLEGRAQSNARVSNYMRNLEGSGWMTNPDLSIIEAKAEEKSTTPSPVSSEARALPYAFTLKVKLANPNAPDADGNIPAAAVAGDAAATTPATPAAAPAPAPATPATTPPPAAAPAATPPSNAPAEPTPPSNEGRPAS